MCSRMYPPPLIQVFASSYLWCQAGCRPSTMDASMDQLLEDPDSEDQGDMDPAEDGMETLTDPPAAGGLPADLGPLLDKPYRPVDAGTPVHALLALVPSRRAEASARPRSPIAASSSTKVMEGGMASMTVPTSPSGSHVPPLDVSRESWLERECPSCLGIRCGKPSCSYWRTPACR